MQTPALILGLVLATLYGAAFHLWRGGGAGRLLLYLVLSWLGFWAGHLLAAWLGWNLLPVGELLVGPATAGSLVFLLAGHWLSLIEVDSG